MKLFIYSCHSTLEYDQASMFLKMGIRVAGHFDVGSTQRPKIKGVTDKTHDLECAFVDADVLLLHQCMDFHKVFEDCCRKMGKRRVILNAFGQGSMDQHRYVCDIVNSYENAYVVSYSIVDHFRYLSLGAREEKMRMIRFGKNLDEYRVGRDGKSWWTGNIPACYMPINSIINRGEGCGWPLSSELIHMDLPIIVSGRETDEMVPCGVGALTSVAQQNVYRMVRCYLSLGTVPAPYTLSLVEALCSGTPVIVYDNRCGVVNEGFGLPIARTKEDIVAAMRALVSDMDLARCYSRLSTHTAAVHFDVRNIAATWWSFFEEMMK